MGQHPADHLRDLRSKIDEERLESVDIENAYYTLKQLWDYIYGAHCGAHTFHPSIGFRIFSHGMEGDRHVVRKEQEHWDRFFEAQRPTP